MLVFRLHYLVFNISFDRVFREKSVNQRQLTYKIPILEKVNLGLFFDFEILPL